MRPRACRFASRNWVDWTVAFVRGHGATRFHCRSVAQWRAVLEALGFAVRAEPMSRGTPFANVLLVARALWPPENHADPAPDAIHRHEQPRARARGDAQGAARGLERPRAAPFETAVLDTCIGEVEGVDDVRLPPALAAWDCRNNRLAELGLAQDGFWRRCRRSTRAPGRLAHRRIPRHQHLGHPADRARLPAPRPGHGRAARGFRLRAHAQHLFGLRLRARAPGAWRDLRGRCPPPAPPAPRSSPPPRA
jgi:hypothetical protein